MLLILAMALTQVICKAQYSILLSTCNQLINWR